MSVGEKSRIYISFIGNLAYKPPEDVLLVENGNDYVQACYSLIGHRELKTDLKIWVRSKAHYTWLQDFTIQIACPALFEEKTPRLVLADQWNVELPDWLQDADVLGHGLLEIEVNSRNPARFETRMLSHFLGTAFSVDFLNSENLVAVIKGLATPEARAAFIKYHLLNRCLQEKCALWSQNTNEPWVREVSTRITDDFTLLWHCLSAWSVLHGYPGKLLEYVLAPDQVDFVRKIPADILSGLPLEPSAREQVLTQIEHFFKEIEAQIKTSDEFKKIIDVVSGRLSREYKFAVNILKNRQFEPTPSDIQALQRKFELCSGVTLNQLNSLIYLVKPDRPTLPASDDIWGVPEWVEWTANEYIPYRAWQIYNKYYDSELEETVVRFSDWYLREYVSIHKDLDLSLAYCLRNISGEKSGNALTVVLLVDCLPLHYLKTLDDAFRNAGFSRHNLSFRFAGLPTVTANNKTALLAGNWLENAEDYEVILTKRAEADWGGVRAIYLNNLKLMSEMTVPQDSAIIVLNLLEADEILHSDVESKNIMYEDELYRLFTRLAEEVSRLSEEWSGEKEQFNVYVVTDHGACRILEEEKRSFDSAIVKKLFPDEKYRFSVVSKEQADEISPNLWEIGHRFKQPFLSEDLVYFIPKGHNTVRQAIAVKGHVHGGATPEEVIVPTAHYKLVKVAWEKPFVRFINLKKSRETGRAMFYILRTSTLEIEVQNPNTADISILRATVLSPEADVKAFDTTTVPAEGVKSLKMSCYFQKSALGEKDLEIEIAYEIEGERHILPLVLKCEFISAQKGGFSLKEL